VLVLSDAGAASPQESRLRVLLMRGGLPRPVQRDLRRINALNACRWVVLRFGAADMRDNPGGVIAAVREALARVAVINIKNAS
jgi:very-short-patch-repair endonuclease